MQEQQDPLVGLASAEHFHVILIAAHAAADDTQQLVLQGRHLCGNPLQILQRHLADPRWLQRLGVAAMTPGPQGIESHQLPGEMKTDHLLLSVFRDGDCLERAFTRDVQGSQFRSGRKQAFPARNRTPAFDDAIEPIDVVRTDPGGQAQLAQRALTATASKPGKIKDNCIAHAWSLGDRVIRQPSLRSAEVPACCLEAFLSALPYIPDCVVGAV
jgi:hypothetical protein